VRGKSVVPRPNTRGTDATTSPPVLKMKPEIHGPPWISLFVRSGDCYVNLRPLALGAALLLVRPLWAQDPPPPAPAPAASPAVEEREKLKTQADEAYRQHDYPKAIEILDKVIKESPTDHVALYLRASAKVEMGAETGAVDVVRAGVADSIAAVKAEGKSRADYYLPYFYGMSALSNLEKTLDHARSARGVADGMLKQTLKPEQRVQILYQRALLSIQLNELPAAKTDLQEVVQSSPEHLAGWMALADVTTRGENFDAASAVFKAALEKNPSSALLLNNRGMFLQANGKDNEAIADFTKALEVDPEFSIALANRGYALLSTGQFEAAEADLTKAMEKEDVDRGILSLRAAARMNLGKLDDALRDCDAAVKLEPKNPLAHADLGFTQFAMGDRAGALKSFDEAQKLDPNLQFLMPWRYAAAVSSGAQPPAELATVQAKEKDKLTWFDLLTLYLASQATEQDLKVAIDKVPEQYRDPQKCEANFFIAMKAQQAGKPEAVKAALEQALKSRTTSLSTYRVAKVIVSTLK
jgi:Tfp pilus assembly protein PilF